MIEISLPNEATPSFRDPSKSAYCDPELVLSIQRSSRSSTLVIMACIIVVLLRKRLVLRFALWQKSFVAHDIHIHVKVKPLALQYGN